MRKVIDRTLAEYDLKQCANIAAGRVSKNQQKLLSVALAMLGDSKIILLDEPTAGLDSVSQRLVWSHIRRAKSKDRIMIISTQEMNEAMALSDRICLLKKGSVKRVGSIKFFESLYNISPKILFSFPRSNEDLVPEHTLKKNILDSV